MRGLHLLAAATALGLALTHGAAAQEGWASGYTRAIADLNLALPVSGRVETLHVREGHCVPAAAPLLDLDNRLEAIEVQRRAALLENRTELNGALARQPVIAMQLRSARALFANSASISREDVQARELAAIALTTEIEMRRAAKEVERIEHEAAREMLDRRTLRAPVAGCIVRIHRFPGESVQALEPVLRLVNSDRLVFISGVDEGVARQLPLGADVRLLLDAESGNVAIQGQVTLVAPVTDPASGLVEIRVEFANPEGHFRAGARARLQLPARQ